MKLIIAEKPSLARNIVVGIQSDGKHSLQKRQGFFEGDGYIVTWAFGHLFSLADIEEYQPNPDGGTRWTMKNLPCFPREFKFELRRENGKIDSGVYNQFNTIKALCNRADVDAIVNAGDADREGEIIVRLCVQKAMNPDKQASEYRLWLPDQTPETIRAALAALTPASDYDRLASEGFARTYIDWLYGVNLTRYATLRSGSFLRVGRVIVPIVKAIYDRDMAIRNFVSDTYYGLSSNEMTNGTPVELNSKLKFEKDPAAPPSIAAAIAEDEAKRKAAFYNQGGAVVRSVKKKKDTVPPGKLYSLTKLQNVLGKKYKMPMDESLAILQKLYESGYVTYPRTNSEYLATAEKDKIKTILESVRKIGYSVAFKDSKTIFDDSKIESHSALTPTYKIPGKNDLGENERRVYATLFRRFAAVFCELPCVVDKTEITIDVAGGGDGSAGKGETFVLKGTVMHERGWTKYDDYTQKDKELPPLAKGDAVNIRFEPVEKQTAPPKHYTIETLNNYLKNPFKEDKARAADAIPDEYDDAEEYRAVFEGLELGTEATRTGIIDNARKSEYILLKKDVYTILPAGEFLIETLSRYGIIMDKYKTSELGKSLKKVFHGESTVEQSVDLAVGEIQTVFSQQTVASPPETDTDDGAVGDEIGTCPVCHTGTVRRTTFGYGCSRWNEGCTFKLSGIILSRVISKENVRLLIETGKTSKMEGFVSKRTGRTFAATLVLQPDGKASFDFT